MDEMNIEMQQDKNEILSVLNETEDFSTMFNENTELFSTLQMNSINDRIKIANAVMGKTEKLTDNLFKTFYLQDFICQNLQLEPMNSEQQHYDEYGNVIKENVARIVLICNDEDGKQRVLDCCSSGVLSSLKMIVALFGMPHTEMWQEPLLIEVQQTKTKKGYNVTKIVPVLDNEKVQQTKTKK